MDENITITKYKYISLNTESSSGNTAFVFVDQFYSDGLQLKDNTTIKGQYYDPHNQEKNYAPNESK